MLFMFQFADVVCHTDCFTNIEKNLHHWDKSHLTMVHDSSNILLDLNCRYLLEDFHINVRSDIGL